MNRTFVDELNQNVGKEVLVKGFVQERRDMGKIIFLSIKDCSGEIQSVVIPSNTEAYAVAKSVRTHWVLAVKGQINTRPDNQKKVEQENGEVELLIATIDVLNEALPSPIDVSGDGYEIGEESRLHYRYLDLRRPRMQRNMKKRAEASMFIRSFLRSHRFTEIDTPILTKTTPEGARDFLVPSRLHHGKFYALPQSPQQYKQLLMVAGYERYFQFARCFRDENARADRAFGEFTQLDMEMSFVTQEDILTLTEELFTKLVKTVFPDKHIKEGAWPRLSHLEAMRKYGTDKPDLRENKDDPDELAFSWTVDFPLFTEQTDDDFFHGSGRSRFAPSHHMFTAPHPDDIHLLDTDPTLVRGLQHDMILNGFEVGGGSIRIHSSAVQEKVFDLIGFTPEQKGSFSHMLEAFSYGVPPHGGIAPGFDRFLMAVLGETSIHEILTFPMSNKGQTAVMEAPSGASKEQLDELGIRLSKSLSTRSFLENG